jgi:hypothetical protein
MAGGGNCNALWGFELTAGGADNFGSGASVINKNFGTALDITDFKYDPTITPRYGLGSRSPQGYKSSRMVTSFGAEFDVQDPYIWELIIGPDATGASNHGTSYYDYVFSEADVLGSMEIQVAETIASGSYLFTELEGVVVQKASMSVDQSSDEPIRLNLSCLAKRPKRSNAIPAAFTSALAADTMQQLSFGNAKWYLASSSSAKGAEIANTDKLDITFDQGFEPKYTLGSKEFQRKFFGERKYEISCINLFDDAGTYMDYLYGDALDGTPTVPAEPQYFQNDSAKGLVLEMVGTQDAALPVTYQWFFTGVMILDHSNPIHGPKDELMEEVRMMAEHCTFYAKNIKEAEPDRY